MVVVVVVVSEMAASTSTTAAASNFFPRQYSKKKLPETAIGLKTFLRDYQSTPRIIASHRSNSSTVTLTLQATIELAQTSRWRTFRKRNAASPADVRISQLFTQQTDSNSFSMSTPAKKLASLRIYFKQLDLDSETPSHALLRIKQGENGKALLDGLFTLPPGIDPLKRYMPKAQKYKEGLQEMLNREMEDDNRSVTFPFEVEGGKFSCEMYFFPTCMLGGRFSVCEGLLLAARTQSQDFTYDHRGREGFLMSL